MERLRRKEQEKKKNLDLSLYSHNLTSQILSREGKHPIRPSIPESTLTTFEKGSLEDRDTYWKEKNPQATFGEQMTAWLGRGEVLSGTPLPQWIEKQKDGDVIAILEEVGLKSTLEQTKADLQEPSVIHLIGTINKDLEKAGKEQLDVQTLSEAEARSLVFYTLFLAEKSGRVAGDLIDTVVSTASSESNGDVNGTIAKLQKVAPLLQVAGEEGQYVLGALMVAKAHAVDSLDMVVQVVPGTALTQEEQRVLDFLKKHQEFPEVEPLNPGEKYNVAKVFGDLEPEPTPGHKYWVENVPDGFVEKLTPEQLKNLELRKPLFLNVRYEGEFIHKTLNREVFDPAYTLGEDQRFRNGELLTDNDSGLFALAAASALAPEQQALLYQQLGETVLRAHIENPKLLEEFLKAQSEGSQVVLIENEAGLFAPSLRAKEAELSENIGRAFQEKFHSNKIETQEQKDFYNELFDRAGEQLTEFRLDEYENIAQSPDRLLAISDIEPQPDALEQFPLEINMPATLAVWPERVKALQEVLHQEPLELTPEQIRQIEFLAHSVDIAKVIDWMRVGQPPEGSAASPTMPPDLAPMAPMAAEAAQQEMPSQQNNVETVEAVLQPVSQETEAPMTALDFFQELEQVGNTIPRRQEFTDISSNELWPFSSISDEIAKFEIVDNTGKIALFTDKKDTSGKLMLENDRNTFLSYLLQPDSLSAVAFQALREKVGDSTLLAYILEAVPNPADQAKLLQKLFPQIALLYGQHESLRTDVVTYFAGVDPTISPVSQENIQRLFGDDEKMKERLTELTAGLQEENKQFSLQDFTDMSLFALPLHLQAIAGRMKLSYRIHEATELSVHAE